MDRGTFAELIRTFKVRHATALVASSETLTSFFIFSALIFASVACKPSGSGGAGGGLVTSILGTPDAVREAPADLDTSLSIGFTSTTPASPSNSSVSPLIKGSADSRVDTVVLFTDVDCSQELARDSKAVFTGAGISVSLPAQAKTYIYGYGINTAKQTTGKCVALTSYTHDSIAPTVEIAAPSKILVNSTHTVTSKTTFTDANTVSLTTSDVTLTKTGTANCTVAVAGTGAIYRTVTLTSCSGDGTVKFNIPAASGSDLAGNTSLAGVSETITVDNTAPTIVISAPSKNAVNSSTSFTYTITYSGASAVTLATTDVTLNQTGTASCSKAVSGSGTATRTITLSSCTGDGTVGISLNSGTAVDTVGNLSVAKGPSSTVIVDNTAPVISGVNSSTSNGYYKAGQTISLQVSFSENVTIASGTPTLTLSNGVSTAVQKRPGIRSPLRARTKHFPE